MKINISILKIIISIYKIDFQLSKLIYERYNKICPSSLWVSLDFEWIWTFLLSEIG
jgi:hypothetical protein